MPSRQRPSPHVRRSETDKRQELRSSARPRRSSTRPAKAKTSTDYWRRIIRPRLVRELVSATESLRWSPKLIEVLLEELYADNDIEELLDSTPRKLQHHQFPQAVALAIILRHSWRADDLASILERLDLSDAIATQKG